MRLITYRSEEGRDSAGVVLGEGTVDGTVDAARLLGRDAVSVRELLTEGLVDELRSRLDDPPDGSFLSERNWHALRPPVPDPDKIICIGLNYRSHAEEAGIEPPEHPTFFAKFRNALAADGAEVKLPAASAKVDYEAEVAVVLGRRCSEVDPGEAEKAIGGYMLFNDLSARDLQFATPQWMPGKVFDDSAPCGPAMVTPDEAGPHDDLSFTLHLNGDQMQKASTSDLVFSIPELISRLSHWMTLEPGDIISTGTPAGVGSVREPRVWLKPGDRIIIESQQLGSLTTTIA